MCGMESLRSKLSKNVLRMSLRRLDQILWHQVSSSLRAKIVKSGTKMPFLGFQWWIQTIIKIEPDIEKTFQWRFWKAQNPYFAFVSKIGFSCLFATRTVFLRDYIKWKCSFDVISQKYRSSCKKAWKAKFF